MNTFILESFISRLEFISKKIESLKNEDYEIKILETNNNKIKGKVIIKDQINEEIHYQIDLIEIDNNTLIFKSTFNTNIQSDIIETKDAFVIVEPRVKAFNKVPKIKYLIHIIDGKINQAYIVNKKYKFTNGINDNYSKVNMDNNQIVSQIENEYQTTINKKR